MPFVTDDADPSLMRGPLGQAVPEEPARAPIGELARAAFETNMIVEGVDLLTRPARRFDPNHNPLDLIKGTPYETDHLDRFVGASNADDTRAIMSRIDHEEARAKVTASGGAPGLALELASGALDPTWFMPFGVYAKGARGLRAARSMAGAAASTGAAVAAQEAVRQTAEETRTAGQSGMAIASGVFLGGILGGAIGGLSRAEVDAMTKGFDDVLRSAHDPAPFVPAPSAAGAAPNIREGLTLEGALGAEKVLGGTSPVTRLQLSPYDAARATVRDLGDAGLSYKENAEGIATSLGGTVETRVKMHQAPLAEAFSTLDDAYARYWFSKGEVGAIERATAPTRSELAQVTGGQGGKLTFKEFKEEVGRAMVRGDDHVIPEVAEVAQTFRSKVFDPLKNEAIAQRLLPENVKPVGAESYLTRVYNRDKIIAEREAFVSRLEDHFRAERDAVSAAPVGEGTGASKMAAMTNAEIRSVVDEVTNTILSESSSRLAGLSVTQGPRGPLRERVLRVPDALIEDFLEKDIEKVSRIYSRTMASDVELARKFGSVTLEEQLSKLRDEFNARTAAAQSPKERLSLKGDYEAARRDIEALRDRVRSVYRLPDNPDGLAHRAAKVFQNLNYLRMLGGMTVAAFTDPARAVMRYGVTTAFRDGWRPYVTSFGTARLAAREVKLAGTALDMVLDTRAHALADLMDDFSRTTKFERAVEGATSRFGLISLMAPWNAAGKQIVGIIAMSEILRATKAVAAGRATPKQVKDLAASGIDDRTARRIWAQFAGDESAAGAGHVKDGVYLPNTESWTDRVATEAFRAAIVREVDNAIVTPGLEKPLWISSAVGKVVGQFKSFALASTQRTLIAGLQQRDAAALQGALLSLALGALVAKTKATLRSEETDDWTPAKWAGEAVDASGLLGVLMDVNNISEKVTRGRVGLSAITGKQISRYQSRNALGALMGPTFDGIGDAIGIVGSASSGEWQESDTRAVRKLLPFSNLFYLRHVFDEVERKTNEAMGVPTKRH